MRKDVRILLVGERKYLVFNPCQSGRVSALLARMLVTGRELMLQLLAGGVNEYD